MRQQHPQMYETVGPILLAYSVWLSIAYCYATDYNFSVLNLPTS